VKEDFTVQSQQQLHPVLPPLSPCGQSVAPGRSENEQSEFSDYCGDLESGAESAGDLENFNNQDEVVLSSFDCAQENRPQVVDSCDHGEIELVSGHPHTSSKPRNDPSEVDEYHDLINTLESLHFDCDICISCQFIQCDACAHSDDGNCHHCDLCS